MTGITIIMEANMKKLVVYFSVSGVTRKAAKELAEVSGSDLYEIVPEESYTEADLDWKNKESRSTVEMQNPVSRPAIKDPRIDLSSYDTVYIGYPIWWGIAPREINTFIESNDLKGKKIMIFATSGGSPIDQALSDIKKTYPDLNIVGGRLLKGKVAEDIL